MTQEEKQLLLQDICGRLPYGVKCNAFLKQIDGSLKSVFGKFKGYNGWADIGNNLVDIKTVRPYLRPMSSMTEEERNELRNILWFGYPSDDNDRYSHRGVEVKQCLYDDEKHSTYDFDDFRDFQNFLLKNHFDYCGLIEKGLALEAPEDMYNIKYND